MEIVPKPKKTQEEKTSLTPTVIAECQRALIDRKQDLFERMMRVQMDYRNRDTSGDEVDKSVDSLNENQMLSTLDRFRTQILEIENALARIEQGTYGICEETDEYIEVERLKAIPWTRLSIEGAEIREALNKRFAR